MKAYQRQTLNIPYTFNFSVGGANIKIMRLSDGYWLDFNDLTYKNSGWTADSAGMTSDDNFTWTYSYTFPQAEDIYKTVVIDTDSNIQANGEIIQVDGNVMFSVASDAGNTSATFKTDLADTVNDTFKSPALIKFLDQNLKGEIRRLAETSAYNGTTMFISPAEAFSAAPNTGSKGLIIAI